MIDSYNYLSVSDVNPVQYPFKSVFQFRPYLGVFNSIPLLVKDLGWNNVYFTSETFDLWELVEDMVSKGLQANNISVGGSGKVIWTDSTTIPNYNFYLEASNELKAKNARVIIVLTAFPVMMACSFYDVGMIGPKYVYLWEGVMYFQSNDPMKPPGCTDDKLTAILQSSIFISQATPMNLQPDFVDQIGMTPEHFDQLMMSRIENGQAIKSWFQWRAVFYSQVVGTALVLDEVEARLKSMGTSLGEWLTNGENFIKNGSFIRNLLHNEFSHFKYKGLNTFGENDITHPVIDAGYHQMQVIGSDFLPVPVASFSGKTGQLSMMKPFQWKTKNNKIPVDSIAIKEKFTPILPDTPKYTMLSIAVIILLSSIVVPVIGHVLPTKMTSPDTGSDYVICSKKFNMFIAFGNALGAIFILVMSVVDYPSAISCSFACVLLIISQWLINSSLLVKLEMAAAVFRLQSKLKGIVAKRQASGIEKNRLGVHSPAPPSTRRSGASPSSRASSALHSHEMDKVSKQKKISWLLLTIPSLISGITAIVWLIVDPMEVENIFIRSNFIDDEDIEIEERSQTCLLSYRSFYAFLIAFISPFVVFLLRIIQVAFVTRHIKSKFVPEINVLRITAYLTVSVSLLGAATVTLLFSSQLMLTLLASLVLVTVILIVNLSFQIYSTFSH